MKAKSKTVFVGMSGGVDSSVAAYLLKKQGYNVVGVFMRSYNIDGCAETDAEDARRVAGHLEIPFYTWDFEEEYKKRVVEYMVEGYRNGLTPNPDVMCNREIKFGLFFEKAMAMGADYVATGHYVSLSPFSRTSDPFAPAANGRLRSHSAKSLTTHRAYRNSESFSQKNFAGFSLNVARDASKDQSYFLWTLTQKQLAHCLFPIGDYQKSKVREIARKAGLPTAEKKDSQGICFLGKVSLAEFLKGYIPTKQGVILTTEGKKIGEHEGAAFYTIGQRHGLDLRTKNRELGVRGEVTTQAHYVVSKDVRTNTLIVAEGEKNEALYRKEMNLGSVNLIDPNYYLPSTNTLSVMARVRYRQKLASAQLLKKNGKYILQFNQPQKFVAPGQSAVFYSRKGEMLGGGVIL